MKNSLGVFAFSLLFVSLACAMEKDDVEVLSIEQVKSYSINQRNKPSVLKDIKQEDWEKFGQQERSVMLDRLKEKAWKNRTWTDECSDADCQCVGALCLMWAAHMHLVYELYNWCQE